MLRTAHDKGFTAALQHYGVKEALDWKGLLGGARRFVIGEPERLLEGKKLFSPGGMLHHSNVFWPTLKNKAGNPDHLGTWMGRTFGTILPAYNIYKTMKGEYGDPNEGRLSNVLGAVGGALGSAYGYPIGGMLGGGALTGVGDSLGRNIGRMLGSRPAQPSQDQLAQAQAMYGEPTYYPGGPYAP